MTQPYYPPASQPQPQYAPQAQPVQQAPAVSAVPMFADPHIPAADPGPSWGELLGRTVAVFASQVGESQNFDKTAMVPTIWFDLYVTEGGPIVFGAAPKANPPRPYPTSQASVPALFKNQMASHGNIVRAVAPFVGKQFVIGVVAKSTFGQKPYILEKLADNDPRMVEAQRVVTGILNGSIVPAPIQPLQMPGMPQAVVAQPQYAPQQPPPGMVMPQAAPPQQYAQAPQQAPQGVERPAHVDPNFWATLSPEQQQMTVAMAAQSAPPQQQQYAPAPQPGPAALY